MDNPKAGRLPEDITILVVEDEELLRQVTVSMLRRKKFKVLEAENGAIAFEIVQKHKVDLVLSDIRMPGGDGVQLLDNIKNHAPDLPVVMFVTGFSDLSLEDAFDKGAAAVFSKPYDKSALLTAILRAVGSPDEAWAMRKHERVDTDIAIDLHFEALPTAIQGRVLNLGRGGLFVALSPPFPKDGAIVKLMIRFDRGEVIQIDGSGVVRWTRFRASESLVAGCGIEFESLSDSSRAAVVNLINTLKTKAFIPKN